MHAAYFRPGGVHQDLPLKLVDDIDAFWDPFLKVCDDIDGLLTDNRIFKQRNVDIGVVARRRLGLGFLGRDGARLGRCVGPAQGAALRVLHDMDFDIPVGKNGDSYDRYRIRMEEMRQSNAS